MPPIRSCHGALALELTPGTAVARTALPRDRAGALAELVSRDLARLVPEAAVLDLVLLAALFDPVELLRPGWPLHAELDRLGAQAPGAMHPRVIAFGDAASAGSGLPQPDPQYAEGPLRLLPFSLRGDAALAEAAGARLEAVLLDTGMAGADTALLAQDAFGATVEHARYLTAHDLAAMTAMQYQHVGLGRVWSLVEGALLAPQQEHWLDDAHEPLVRVQGRRAQIALIEETAWLQRLPEAGRGRGAEVLERGFRRFQIRQRQIGALLEAHGLELTFEHCPPGQDARALLAAD
jgi:hypothetical protein